MSPLQILAFLFDLYIWIVLMRFVLQQTRADFYNPLSQFVVKATQPILKPMRRVIPGLGGIDWASLILAFLLVALRIALTSPGNWFDLGALPMLLKFTVFELTLLMLQLFFWAVLMRALISWVDPYGANPIARVLAQITDPMLKPIRRVLPDMGGLDLSPLFLMLFLQLLMWFVRELAGGRFF